MQPHELSPEWAIEQADVIPVDRPESIEALMFLLAETAPTVEQDKYKHDAAKAAILHLYRKTKDCEDACWRYLGTAI